MLINICYALNVCVPPNSYVEALTPNLLVFGGETWEIIRFDEVMRVSLSMMASVPDRKRPELLSTT